MDLIGTAWNTTHRFTPDHEILLPANYAGYGGYIFMQNATPTIQSPPVYHPHIPQWNTLTPIVWEEYVLHPAELSALIQAGLVQVPNQAPASYQAPGTASLMGGV